MQSLYATLFLRFAAGRFKLTPTDLVGSVRRVPVCWVGGRGQTINQGLKKPGEIMLAVTKTPFSVQMIASLGGDVTPFALSPSSLHISWKGK